LAATFPAWSQPRWFLAGCATQFPEAVSLLEDR
jgi:hypothetical protein